jgi:aminopeptidase N
MRSRSVLFILVVIAGFAPAVLADMYPRQPAVDAQHYRFTVTVSDDSPRIEGETTATLRLVSAVHEVQFDLKSEVAGKGMAVSRVTADGHDVTFDHRADRLRVTLPGSVQPGADVSLTIR